MDLIAIGRILKPIGRRGEVKIHPLTDDKDRFKVLQSVWVGDDETTAELDNVAAVRVDKKHVVVSLETVETTYEAEQLRHKYLLVPKEKAVKPRTGSFFVNDVIGCEVVTEEQIKIGVVTDLLTLPANDVWVVWNGVKEILIPAVKAIIRQVDVENKRITIHMLEGLLE